MKAILLPVSLVIAFSSLVVCGACSSEAGRTPSTAAISQAEASRCPLGVPGAEVAVEDTRDGVALTFTSQNRPDDLRQRVADAAELYGPGARAGKGHNGKHGTGGSHGLQAMQLPPAHAVAQDVVGGARIDLRPVDPTDLEALRAKARERAGAMMSTCD